MPFIVIHSDTEIRLPDISVLKQHGELLGYADPQKIWISTQTGMKQHDVVMVLVHVTEVDFLNGNFHEFCARIGDTLRNALKKSVEVATPAHGPMRTVAWCPTEAGVHTYGAQIAE